MDFSADWTFGPQLSESERGSNPNVSFVKNTSPWDSPSNRNFNLTTKQGFDFALFLYKNDSVFRQAIHRIASYFVTDIEFYDPTGQGELKEDEIKRYKTVLIDRLKLKQVTFQNALEALTFGNFFVSVFPPLDRRLSCPKCGVVHPLPLVASKDNNDFHFKFNLKKQIFEAKCPTCGSKGNWIVSKFVKNFETDSVLQRWNPYEMSIEYCPFNAKSIIKWPVSARMKKKMEDGDPAYLNSVPDALFTAAAEDKYFEFNNDYIYHGKTLEISDIGGGAWGVPMALYCYRAARNLFGLKQMNEALTSDYMVPFRVVSPLSQQEMQTVHDIGPTFDFGHFFSDMTRLMAARKKNPTSIHISGEPLQYQILGGEANNLVNVDLLKFAEDMELNAMGVPAEFYRGSLQLQTAPMAARLFESHWSQLVDILNGFLQWIANLYQKRLGWDPVGIRLIPPKVADDMEDMMLKQQLFQAGKMPIGDIYKRLGMDTTDVLRRIKDEAIETATFDSETQVELDKLMQGNQALNQVIQEQAAASQGAAPPPQGGSGQPASPGTDINSNLDAWMNMVRSSYANPNMPVPMNKIYDDANEGATLMMTLPEIEFRAKLKDIENVSPLLSDAVRSAKKRLIQDRNRQAIAQSQPQGQPAQ